MTGYSTASNGAPSPSERNSLTVGPNGPILLHDHHMIDAMAHFNRQMVPDRQPHAKGGGAFGVLEITEDVSQFTKAKALQKGKKTRTLARFSTVALESGSTDTVRDVRGFSLKFYTEDGNWDIVGNNTPVFFIRDAIKFPHFIRSQKRLSANHLRDGSMQWDFWTLNPESAHQVTYLMGDRGIPTQWAHMDGFGSHTYQWVNAKGDKFWVKYHFKTDQGHKFFTDEEAAVVRGQDPDYNLRGLYEQIQRGENPSWTFKVQIMPYEEAASYRFNPFDLTKTWSQKDYPLIEVGRVTLNENPLNYHTQIEQAAFSPGNLVPGVGLSPDKMLLGRVFAYADAQRYRIGPNFHQLPVNRPIIETNTYMFDGPMNMDEPKDEVRYAPNTMGRAYSDGPADEEEIWGLDGELVRAAYNLHPDDDDFGQAGTLVREVMDDEQRERLAGNIAGSLAGVGPELTKRVLEYWRNVDADLSTKVEQKNA